MKNFFPLILFFCATNLVYAQQTLNCSDKNSNDRAACQLGYKVIQGLLVAQDQGTYPQKIDLQMLYQALNNGQVSLENKPLHSEMSLEEKGNLLYRSMMNATGQKMPQLKLNHLRGADPQSSGNSFQLSTGTRGGGDDLDPTSLPLNIWY